MDLGARKRLLKFRSHCSPEVRESFRRPRKINQYQMRPSQRFSPNKVPLGCLDASSLRVTACRTAVVPPLLGTQHRDSESPEAPCGATEQLRDDSHHSACSREPFSWEQAQTVLPRGRAWGGLSTSSLVPTHRSPAAVPRRTWFLPLEALTSS